MFRVNSSRAAYLAEWRRSNPEKHAGYRQSRRDLIDGLKNVPCVVCGGEFPPECMDFNHINPLDKEFNVGSNIWGDLDRLLAEIDKCEVICANCHRTRTRAQGYFNRKKKG